MCIGAAWHGVGFREQVPFEGLCVAIDLAMVEAHVAWDPTLDIYEASRDLQRARTQPWFGDYLHPTLEEYFRPDPSNHGSYFFGWTSTDETFWKENYQIWMRALREFDRRGGLIGISEDAGFIYQMYGFGFLRNLELHQEAGFHPLKIIQQATGNNARLSYSIFNTTTGAPVRTDIVLDGPSTFGNDLRSLSQPQP